MDDILLLPDEETISKLAREYAKMKRRNVYFCSPEDCNVAGILQADTASETVSTKDDTLGETAKNRARILLRDVTIFLQYKVLNCQNIDDKLAIRSIVAKNRELLRSLANTSNAIKKTTEKLDKIDTSEVIENGSKPARLTTPNDDKKRVPKAKPITPAEYLSKQSELLLLAPELGTETCLSVLSVYLATTAVLRL